MSSKIKPFKKLAKKNINLKNSESWAKECISLPIHPKLHTNQAYRIVKEIKNYFKNK